MSAEPSLPTTSPAPRFGVWLIGARGSVATTAIALSIARRVRIVRGRTPAPTSRTI